MTELWATERVERGLVDREGWGPGPWDDEPDVVLWSYAGIVCLIARHPHYGTLNGYVRLPPTHSLYEASIRAPRVSGIRVHGGVTYAGRWPQTLSKGDYWWIGFDCGHAFDISPAILARCPELADLPAIPLGGGRRLQHRYRPIGYVRAEVERMVDQVRRYPSVRRVSKRVAAKRRARYRRIARKQLVRMAGAREPIGLARAILSALNAGDVRVSVPRSFRTKRKSCKSLLN